MCGITLPPFNPRGTGYVTELGMTGRLGHTGGGFDPRHFAARLRGEDITTLPAYSLATSPLAMGAVLITTTKSGDTETITRVH